MKRIAKLLLAVLVLCGACDAVGLGGDASGGGAGGGGNVNLVGTTWRGGTINEETDPRYPPSYVTITINFTSRTGGTVLINSHEYICEYSVSGNSITITYDIDDTFMGTVDGSVMNLLVWDRWVPFYKV